jgi:hypothetical protein
MNNSQTLRRCALSLCLMASALSCAAQSSTNLMANPASAYSSNHKPLIDRLVAAKKSCEESARSRQSSRCPTRLNTKGGAEQPVKAPWYWFSDERLKKDIALLEQLPSGLNLYAYRYVWADTVYVGVMAQEVASVMPEAVMETPDGHLMVNYRQLGLELLTLEQWVAEQGRQKN